MFRGGHPNFKDEDGSTTAQHTRPKRPKTEVGQERIATT